MATVKHFLTPEEAQFLASSFPQFLRIAGSNFPVTGLAFSDAAQENAYWKLQANNYGSGNLTANLVWYADTASTANVVWGAQLAAITPESDTQDVETKSFATAQTVTDSHLGTTGQRLHRATITISNLDSIAADDICWLKLYRDGASGSDTLVGDAILILGELTYSDT